MSYWVVFSIFVSQARLFKFLFNFKSSSWWISCYSIISWYFTGFNLMLHSSISNHHSPCSKDFYVVQGFPDLFSMIWCNLIELGSLDWFYSYFMSNYHIIFSICWILLLDPISICSKSYGILPTSQFLIIFHRCLNASAQMIFCWSQSLTSGDCMCLWIPASQILRFFLSY